MTELEGGAPDDLGADPEAGGASAEGTGETVGEAKWAALRELERRFPGVDKERVRFQVVSEGERGLLGVGYAPAQVVATAPVEARVSEAAAAGEPAADEEPGSPPARLRELLDRIAAGLDVSASVTVAEAEGRLEARFAGPDVGLLIGKRGQTIDAIQYLANAVFQREAEERLDVVVDAAGYRDRRRAALERIAENAAREALTSGRPVSLEPMPATERKVVHLFLQRRGGVDTLSEGTEPNRRIVVAPAEPEP